MQSFVFHDLVGTVGVALILLCYFLIQMGYLAVENLRYSVLNLVGATLILYSLYYEFNFASVLIEGFWVIISLIGIVRYFRRQAASPEQA